MRVLVHRAEVYQLLVSLLYGVYEWPSSSMGFPAGKSSKQGLSSGSVLVQRPAHWPVLMTAGYSGHVNNIIQFGQPFVSFIDHRPITTFFFG